MDKANTLECNVRLW